MKSLLNFLLIFSLFTIAKGQETITLTSPNEGEFWVFDTLRVTITAGADGASFYLPHPELGAALQNKENLINYWVDEYQLTSLSSLYEIVTSVASFYKTSELQGNEKLLTYNINPEPGRILAVQDLSSVQCDNYSRATIDGCKFLAEEFGINQINFRHVDLTDSINGGGHSLFEYLDPEFGWVLIDPDNGSSLISPRDEFGPVSYSDIETDPSVLLSPYGITWNEVTFAGTDSLARQVYLDFLTPMFENPAIYTPSSDPLEDDRSFLYEISSNTQVILEVVAKELSFDTDLLNQLLLETCLQATESGDNTQIELCLEEIGLTIGVSVESMFWLYENRMLNTNSESLVYFEPDNSGGSHITMKVQEGVHQMNFPHLIRSIEPSITGLSFEMNGITHTDSSFLEIYFPLGTELLNIPGVQAESAEYDCNFIIPSGLSLVQTRYFNYLNFPFWEQDLQIVVTDGEVEIEQEHISYEESLITSVSEEVIPETIKFFPNPSTGLVRLSESSTVKVYDMAGRLVFSSPKTNSMHLDLMSGHYMIEFDEGIRQRLILIE